LLNLIHEIKQKKIFHEDLVVALPLVFAHNPDLWDEFRHFLPIACEHFQEQGNEAAAAAAAEAVQAAAAAATAAGLNTSTNTIAGMRAPPTATGVAPTFPNAPNLFGLASTTTTKAKDSPTTAAFGTDSPLVSKRLSSRGLLPGSDGACAMPRATGSGACRHDAIQRDGRWFMVACCCFVFFGCAGLAVRDVGSHLTAAYH
jgi:hypothetical protein